MSRYKKPVGWRGESHRHYLAAKGIHTRGYFSIVRGEWAGVHKPEFSGISDVMSAHAPTRIEKDERLSKKFRELLTKKGGVVEEGDVSNMLDEFYGENPDVRSKFSDVQRYQRWANKALAAENAEVLRRLQEGRERAWSDPVRGEELRLSAVERGKRLLDDPEHKQKMIAGVLRTWEDPEFRLRKSEEAKKMWQDEGFRKVHAEANERLWRDEEFRERQREGTKKLWEDESFREKVAGVQKSRLTNNWKDPEYRQKMSEMSREKADEVAAMRELRGDAMKDVLENIGEREASKELKTSGPLSFYSKKGASEEDLRRWRKNVNMSAEYRVRPDGKVSVKNMCGGREVSGVARSVSKDNRKLKVSFGFPFGEGDYNIKELDKDYSRAVVKSGRTEWVLRKVA